MERSSLNLDRAALLRRDLDRLEALLGAPQSVVVPVWRDLSLVQPAAEGNALSLLPMSDAGALFDAGGELVFLGMLEERACFAIDASPVAEPLRHEAFAQASASGSELVDLRLAGATLPESEAMLAAYARGILYWHRRHRFCGACGSETAPRQGGHVRVCRNPACASEHFPRTDPAIIVLVHDGDRCLLGRQRGWPARMYSTLAGFVEPGETLEHAVAREVLEEAGVHVTDMRYVRSQPWPFPSSLMLGFFARATSHEIALGEDELEDARWVRRDELLDPAAHGIVLPPPFSVASRLIGAFVRGEIG